MDIYYLDGKFVPADRAALPLSDLAIIRGYGVFEYLRTYGGEPFRLREHLARLERSAELTGIPFPGTTEEIAGLLGETLKRNDHGESSIRIILTGGDSPDSITPGGEARLIITASAFRSPPSWWYEEGVRVTTETRELYLPAAKTLNYIPAIIALDRARKEGAVETIVLDREGNVREGVTTNCFAFIGEKLVTPDSGVLAGITRQVVLELAEGRHQTEVRTLKYDELIMASEVFITATNKEIVPVTGVDEAVIGEGIPGPRTLELMELFRGYAKS